MSRLESVAVSAAAVAPNGLSRQTKPGIMTMRRTQTLKRVIALCPDCHHIRHWGKSIVDGREEDTLRHLMAINGWTLAQAEHATDEAMTQWEERSRHK